MSKQSLNSFNGRRIAIFQPHSELGTIPNLMCLIRAFISNGARVDVMMPDPGPYPPMNGEVNRYPYPRPLPLWCGGIRTTLRSWWERIRLMQIDRVFTAGAYDLIIGVNSAGIIKGYEYARRFNVALVYLCLEIFFHDELTSKVEIEEKKQECIASQFADLVLISDQWRARLLAAENSFSSEKFEYLPVSPAGSPMIRESDYLRRRFNISERKTIVLHSGSFTAWSCADELLENVTNWPEDFVLIIHTRYKPGESDRYVHAIHQTKLSNVILSTEPFPIDEYEKLVASADIGLVLYKQVPPSRYSQKNIQTVGLASGKFSFYMKYGIPVVSVDLQDYDRLLADYAFGENIASFSEMPAALMRVRTNYVRHQAEAKRIFSEKLDFDIYWPRLAIRLLEVIK